MPQKDGHTLREHLEAAKKQGADPAELRDLVAPEGVEHVWQWFLALHRGRASGFGPSGLSHAEIEAWSRLYGLRPSPFELDCLVALDGAFLRHAASREPGP